MPTASITYHDPVGVKTKIDADHPFPVQDVSNESANVPGTLNICDTIAVVGPTPLVAAPGAALRVVVTAFVLQNLSTTATTIILRAGPSDKWRCLGQNQGDGLAMSFARGIEWRLPANTALNIVLSGANSCGYSIQYYIEGA